MKKVLFICVHNSGRSQMAAEFLKELSKGAISSISASTIPDDKVNPVVAKVMLEKGIDISRNKPKLLTQEMIDGATRIITMGCSMDEACPAVFVPSEDWGLDDPKGKPIEAVRKIRDEIETKVKALLATIKTETESKAG